MVWVGDDGQIMEPEEPPKPSAFFDQDDVDVELEARPGVTIEGSEFEVRGQPVEIEWNPPPEPIPSPFASVERVDAIESKLDKLIALLSPPEHTTAAEVLADPRVIKDEHVFQTVATADPTVSETKASAKIEALKAEQEARQAHGNMPPEEAVAQGLGITKPRPGPEDIEDGRGFRDQPLADDPFDGLS